MKRKKEKKMILAVLAAAAISAAASGCSLTDLGFTDTEQQTELTEEEDSDAGRFYDETPDDDFGETDGGEIADNSGTAAAGAELIMGEPRRVEALGAGQTAGNGILPPSDGAELSLLISDYCGTDYEAAAESFLAMGGNIKVTLAARGDICSALSAKALSKLSVDIAQFDNGMLFPYGAAKGLIQPADLAVDISGSKWEECRKLSRDFTMNNWHYVLVFSKSAETSLYYDKSILTGGGLDDPQKLYAEGKWTTDRFADMLRRWKAKGADCTIAGHDWERGLLFGSGRTMIRYDGEAEGYSSNIYCHPINGVQGYIYGLKNDDIIGSTEAGSLDSALADGVLFWSGNYDEGEYSAYVGDLQAVPYPTLHEGESCYAAKIDGLVLVNGSKALDSARAYFECVLEQPHGVSGRFGEVFRPAGDALYDFGMGISPIVSDSEAHANEDFDKAIIPLMYAAGPDIGSWDDICYYFSYKLHPELTKLNNMLSERIFGDQYTAEK